MIPSLILYKGNFMNKLFLTRVALLMMCICLALVAWVGFVPAKTAHAAAHYCQDDYFPTGTVWFAGHSEYAYTCSGQTIRLTYQTDGNFVLYINGSAKWASNTAGATPTDATTFQSDGNLVVYEWGVSCIFLGCSYDVPTPVWASGTNDKGGSVLALQHDGNLVIYNGSNKAIWASNTCCYS